MILAISLFTIVANLCLGIAVLVRNPKSATHRLFGLYALFVAVWAFTNYYSLAPGLTDMEFLFRVRIVMVAAGTLCPFLFLLALVFPESKLRLSPAKWVMFVLFSAITTYVGITPYTFNHLEVYYGLRTVVPGIGLAVYSLNAVGLPVFAFIVLLRKYRRSFGRVHSQTRLFMIGIAISYLLGEFTNFILLNALHFGRLVVLGPFFTLILVGFVAYAIIKYRFLDIRLFVLRSVTYILLLAAITAIYVFGSIVLVQLFFPNAAISREVYFTLLFLSIAIASGIGPLYRAIRRLVGKYFFKNVYQPEDLVFDIMRIRAADIDYDVIAPKILARSMETIGMTKAAILTVEDHRVIDIKEAGFYWDSRARERTQSFEDSFHRPDQSDSIVFEQLHDERQKEIFRSFDLDVILPIRIENREVALMFCGPKAAGDTYTERDLSTLKIIANQIGETIESTRKFRLLKQVDVTKSDFIHSVSHEFRTPLTEIRWKLETLLGPNYAVPVAPALKSEFTDIYFSIRWLVESLNQLILASDIEVSTPQLAFSDVDMRSFFTDEVFGGLKEIALLKKISLKLEVLSTIEAISIDSTKMKTVFQVLVENAIKYSPDGETVVVRLSERITEDSQNKFLRIEVEDHGIGMREKDLPHLFSKFYRGENARSTQPNGLGLGLFIAKSLVELHGGKIWVQAKNSGGAIFFVEIPYKHIVHAEG